MPVYGNATNVTGEYITEWSSI